MRERVGLTEGAPPVLSLEEFGSLGWGIAEVPGKVLKHACRTGLVEVG